MKGMSAGEWRNFGAILVVFAALASGMRAENPELKQAVGPLEEGLPQVSVLRLRGLLGSNLTPQDRAMTSEKLAEALFAAGASTEALKVLDDPALLERPAARFCRAQALADLKRWPEALPLYRQLAAERASGLRSDAILGQAEALRALHRADEALQTFALLFSDPRWSVRAQFRSIELLLQKHDPAAGRRLLDKTKPILLADKKEKRFLQGRLEGELGHFERAIELFQTIRHRPEGASRGVLVATLCAIADANLQLKTPEASDDPLEDFIEHHPADPELAMIFARLDEVYRAQQKPSTQELRRWARDAVQPRRAFAQWYLARSELRSRRRENALRILADLRAEHVRLPAVAEGLFEFAQLKIEDQRFDEALAILDDARTVQPAPELLERINLLAGRAQYQAEHFDLAAKTFEQLARSAPHAVNEALYNASLAWLQAGDHGRFLVDYQDLRQSGGNEEARGDLLLEEGLAQAAQGNGKAAETVQGFLREFPRHKRSSEAWVALADLAFHAVPPHLDEARKNLARARESEPNTVAKEHTDYLAIWIEDTPPSSDSAKVVALANQFLQQYPASRFGSDVRMKLAEIYYRQQDFSNAQTHFEILAQENSNAALTEKALFFAAKSAMQSMGAQSLEHALVLLDEVVKRNGELKWAARNEQAMIERKLGKAQDAATLYDEVLRGEAKPEEKREALCGKGDILYEAGAADRENYKRAIAVYEQIASEKEVSSHWRNQALFKKGVCLEKLDERDEALAAFYKIIEDGARPDRPREFFWYYKAGFNAARLLEDDSKWQPAAVIYQRLASAGGARSDEAKSRLDRLRLEHFLWEQ